MNKRCCYWRECSVLLLLAFTLLSFSISYLIKSHETKSLWDISLWVFTLFGVLITLGAAIPAITVIFSYQGFIKESEEVRKKLEKIESRQQDLQQKIEETLPNLEKEFTRLKQLLLADETKKRIYDLLKKGDKLTEKERDELFCATESSSYQLYNCSLYQLIAIKQQEVELYEGTMAEDEAVYGEIPNKEYREQQLQQLKADLLELCRIAGLFDREFEQKYLKLKNKG